MQRSIILDLLSTLSQRELYLQDIQKEDLTGALRLDILLFGRLLIPDTYLFDGCLLLDMFSPSELAAACGHSVDSRTVEIRLRRPTFREAWHSYIMDDVSRSLRPIEFRYLRDERLEKALASRLSNSVVVPPGEAPDTVLAQQMVSVGVAKGIAAARSASLGSWGSESSKLGMLGQWPRRGFPLAEVMRSSPLAPEVFASGSGVSGYRAISHLVDRGDTASASVDHVLRKHFSESGNSDALADEMLLREWYHDSRQIAIAKQHQCMLSSRPADIKFLVPALLKDSFSPAAVSSNASEAGAVHSMVYVLGSLTETEYRSLLSKTGPYRRQWLSTRGPKELSELIEMTVSELAPPSLKPEKPWYQQERIILPTASTIAGYVASGPPAALAAGVLTVGLNAAVAKVSDLFTKKGHTKALVRWAMDSLDNGE